MIELGILKCIYPDKCIFCHRVLNRIEQTNTNEFYCNFCLDRIKSENKGLMTLNPSILDEEKDKDLLIETLPQRVLALLPYSGEYRKAILRWKYRGYRKYAKGFAKLLVEEIIKDKFQDVVLVPIPLAPSRMKKRGYNQALDLAKEIGKLTGFGVLDCLVRTKDTKPQIRCTREQRYKNIYNSMECNINKVNKNIKRVLLVDDIYTTGSTIKEATRIIKRQYIFRDVYIDILVLAKGAF